MNLAKTSVLLLLDACGYVLLRKSDHQKLTNQASQSHILSSPQPPPTSLPTVEPSVLFDDSDFASAMKLVEASELSPLEAYTMHSAARYLVKARIPGSIIDCGDGSPDLLAIVAATLCVLGDTTREITLLDVTGDPAHRGETELRPWGADHNLLDSTSPSRLDKIAKHETPPKKLLATGYPLENIFVRRSPEHALDFATSIAFLAVTTDRYPANRFAIRTFLPRLSSGAVIVSNGRLSDQRRGDALDDALRAGEIDLQLWHVSEDHRVGVFCKPARPSK